MLMIWRGAKLEIPMFRVRSRAAEIKFVTAAAEISNAQYIGRFQREMSCTLNNILHTKPLRSLVGRYARSKFFE